MFLSKEFDKKLLMAFDLYNKELYESLPSDEELGGITFSDAFENKMQKLINAQKKSYYYMINTVGKRVAIILLTLFISLTVTTFGVKAIRESVIEFITETFDKFTKVTVKNEDTSATHDVFIKASPQYIPQGYTVESEIDVFGVYQIYYTDKNNNTIDYHQEFGNLNTLQINTENVEYENITINSYDGVFYNNGSNTIVFADETYLYKVYGQISKDELIKIAESIK